MIVILILSVWFMWLIFVATKLIKTLLVRIEKWDHGVDEIKYLITEVKFKVSKFLLKILDKKIKKV